MGDAPPPGGGQPVDEEPLAGAEQHGDEGQADLVQQARPQLLLHRRRAAAEPPHAPAVSAGAGSAAKIHSWS
ncbi:hypothetical protein [Blastococcus sp. TF02A-26]|uniref:hypothetical protein n=1 Tax=Blastococcus sp. TF02A-26 TaxID=2250577 RepID=UPI001F40B916|nr:hypothetical protein [Blastococcus sp. TF02A-26]